MRVTALRTLTLVLFCTSLALVSGGCKERNAYVAPPPPAVTVAHPVQKAITEYIEFTGNTQSMASVDIRARAQGFLEKVHFKDGAMVKKGDLLFIIDPKPYQASVDKSLGDLASKQAQFDRAEIEYQRNLRLMKENATSEKELNTSKASRDSAKADVAIAAANLDSAQINLGYATIRAPLSGKIGRSMVDAGNLVGAGEYTLLTTIKQYDPIYAYFNLNEQDLLRIMRRYRGKEDTVPVPVYLGLADEEGYPHEGVLDYGDLGVDPSTGTYLLRAVFKNPPPPEILPGFFVRLRVPVDAHENAVMVPDRAIGVDQKGKFVMVVDKDNVVEQRPVKIGILENGLREIEEGLNPNEIIVVSGLQKARPGAKITPVPAQAQPAGAGASPSPAPPRQGKGDNPASGQAASAAGGAKKSPDPSPSDHQGKEAAKGQPASPQKP